MIQRSSREPALRQKKPFPLFLRGSRAMHKKQRREAQMLDRR